MQVHRLSLLVFVAASVAQSPFTVAHTLSAGSQSTPTDVAVFTDGGATQYTYVADTGLSQVQRFDGIGATGLVTATYPTSNGPYGIAVNKAPGHCNYGMVYITDRTGPGSVLVLDQDLVFLKQVTIPGGFGTPKGIAIDAKGDVYVADTQNNYTYRIDSAWFEPPFQVSVFATVAKNMRHPTLGAPLDVSVDHNYRAHVTNTCGCLTVFEPDGTVHSNLVSTTPFISGQRGIDARSPSADSYLTRGSGGNFRMYNWSTWVPPTPGAINSMIHGPGLTSPDGLEYQEYDTLSFLANGSLRRHCTPRMFVADAGNNESVVYSRPIVSSIPTPTGATAWWKFDDVHDACSGTAATVRDELGSNNGVSAGTAIPLTVEGIVGHAFETAGGLANIRVPNSPNLNFGTGSFSIEGWLRTDQTTSGVITVLDKRVGTGAGYSVYLYGGRLGFQTNVGASFQNFSASNSAAIMADGAWHYFAIVVDRSAAMTRLYVDGAPVGATSALAGNVDNAGDLILGARNYSGTSLAGALDELELYDRALTAAEIGSIYQASCAGKDVPPVGNVATANAFGSGCTLSLSSNLPVLGTTWSLVTSQIDPVSPFAFTFFGDRGPAIPLPLIGLNAPGCSIHLATTTWSQANLSTGGSATAAFAIPANPALVGVAVSAQSICLTLANSANLLSSNGLEGIVGY